LTLALGAGTDRQTDGLHWWLHCTAS